VARGLGGVPPTMSAILRHRHPNRFTILPNDAIRNQALSFRAVGVLAHLLSLPDGAKVDSATLATAHREGRDAVRAAYKELEAHGYYRRDVLRLADGTLRTEVVVSSTPMNGETPGRTEDGFPGAGPGPENPAPVEPAPVNSTSAGPAPVDQASKEEVPKTQNLFSPQTPRTAGGHDVVGSRRQAGTNPRARGTHPRAEAELAEAARLEAEAAARQAALQRATDNRRASDQAAEFEAERLEAEALAVSAALTDPVLAQIVDAVTGTMAGPLARSPLAIARAVVAWCRTAVAEHPGPLGEAASAALVSKLVVREGDPQAALDLPPAPPGTALLRHRIAALVRRAGEGSSDGRAPAR
jgi:hypothetical protein